MLQQANTSSTKPKVWIYLLPLAILGGLICVFIIGLGLNPRLLPSPLINKPVPVFSLPRLEQQNQVFTQLDLSKEISLLNIWATWCTACKQEHIVLMEIAKSQEIPIYGLLYKDNPANGDIWLERLGNPYDSNAVDQNGKVGIEWGAYGTPESFIIDARGVIRYKHVGPITWKDWRDKLLPIVLELKNEPA